MMTYDLTTTTSNVWEKETEKKITGETDISGVEFNVVKSRFKKQFMIYDRLLSTLEVGAHRTWRSMA